MCEQTQHRAKRRERETQAQPRLHSSKNAFASGLGNKPTHSLQPRLYSSDNLGGASHTCGLVHPAPESFSALHGALSQEATLVLLHPATRGATNVPALMPNPSPASPSTASKRAVHSRSRTRIRQQHRSNTWSGGRVPPHLFRRSMSSRKASTRAVATASPAAR